MATLDIDIEKIYNFAEDIKVVEFDNKYIIINPNSANWIVLNTIEQLSILNFLKCNHSIRELFSLSFSQDDINVVVTQLEARNFCNNNGRNSFKHQQNLHLYLTNKCNLHCPHCYMNSGMGGRQELTTNEVLDLFKNYRIVANGERVTISGGEPTARTDFRQIIEGASKLGLTINLLTNGSLLSSNQIKFLSRFISSVQISIDGFSEETNAVVRGHGNFQKALETVDAFVKNNVDTSIAMTPSYEILKRHIDDYALFAQKIIHKYSKYHFRVKFTEKLSPGRNLSPTKKENEEYSHWVRHILENVYGYDYDLVQFIQVMNNDILTENCMFGKMVVASTGDVYLCPEIGKLHSVANIKKEPFSRIYDLLMVAEKATSVDKLQPCNECELRYICGGGCRIEEFSGIAELKSFDSIQNKSVLQRTCDSKVKDRFYDLMVRSNEYLYKV